MIIITPYDSAWPAQFAAARAEMLAACKGLMLDVYHVGSTSVPDLAAKPIIDMMPVLSRHEDGIACIKPMEAIGYLYRGERGIEGRHLFVRGEPRTHNVHAFAFDNRGSRVPSAVPRLSERASRRARCLEAIAGRDIRHEPPGLDRGEDAVLRSHRPLGSRGKTLDRSPRPAQSRAAYPICPSVRNARSRLTTCHVVDRADAG
jgi:hypothetical protein